MCHVLQRHLLVGGEEEAQGVATAGIGMRARSEIEAQTHVGHPQAVQTVDESFFNLGGRLPARLGELSTAGRQSYLGSAACLFGTCQMFIGIFDGIQTSTEVVGQGE